MCSGEGKVMKSSPLEGHTLFTITQEVVCDICEGKKIIHCHTGKPPFVPSPFSFGDVVVGDVVVDDETTYTASSGKE